MPETTRTDQEIAYVDISSVTSDGAIRTKELTTFGGAPSRARRIVRAGDVLISTVRTYLRAIAHVKDAEENLIASTGFSVLRSRNGIEPRFLYYLLRSHEFVERVVAYSEGIGYPAIPPSRLDALPAWRPTLREQSAICSYLDHAIAKIDALIAKKERLIASLQEKRIALITRAVMKGLKHDIPMRDSGVECLGQTPAHWRVKRLMWLTPKLRPIMYGIVLPGPNVEEGVPIVKSGDVSPDRLRLDLLSKTTFEIEAGYARSRLAANDVVYAIRGSIGMAALVPTEIEGANLTQDAARIAPGKGIRSDWLLYAVQSASFFAMLDAGARGATIRGINIWDLKRAIVAVPPEHEQIEIAAFLKKETAKLDSLMATIQDGIERLREFRTALISDAVTGKIDVQGLAT